MPAPEPLLPLAVILLFGIVGGEIMARFDLPKVTGWIAAGVLLRPLELPGLEPSALGGFEPVVDFVLGYIAFFIGTSLRVHDLRNAEKRLALLLLGEVFVTPAIVFLAMVSIGGLPVDTAMLLAAIAIAGAPGTTLVVVREARARGLLSSTLLAAVGLIDVVAIGVYTFCAAWQRQGSCDWLGSLRAVSVEFGLALAVGLGLCLLAIGLSRRLVSPKFVGPMMVAVILGAWGLAHMLGTSSILACTFAGIALANLQRDRARAAGAYLRPFGGVLFAGFYTLVGLHLDFALIVPMAGLVLLFFGARFGAKYVGSFVAMSLAGAPRKVRDHLGLALLPQGGVAVGLIFMTQADPALAGAGEAVAAIGLAALAIAELVGPNAVRLSLRRVDEAGQDQPRLLDFLDEQHIVHDVRGDFPEVVEALADRLYATTDVPMPKSEFIAAVLQREAESSTCLGRGLAIPHAILPEGERICGVLGLSAEGIDLGAHDGQPVHAIMLLATPECERKRHLEILAATARNLVQNRSLREQLYYAHSATHAYEVLNSSATAEDLNYVLADARPR